MLTARWLSGTGQTLVGNIQTIDQNFDEPLVEVHPAGFGGLFQGFAANRDDVRFGDRRDVGAAQSGRAD